MKPQESAEAVPGLGLKGDRYFAGTGTFSVDPRKPDYELTLVEAEKIEEFARQSGLPFTALEARRNVVTRGIDLNELVGREFWLGPVRAKGVRLCEPCNYLAKKTFPAVLRGLVHKVGLRAQVLTPGTIRVGDRIGAVE